jgi:WD40 repeat protein
MESAPCFSVSRRMRASRPERLAAILFGVAMATTGCSVASSSIAPWKFHDSLEVTRAGVVAMAYSPDGQLLATSHYPIESYGTRVERLGSPPAFVWIWHVGEQSPITMFPVVGLNFQPIQFSADSKRLLVTGKEGITVWDATRGGVSRMEMEPPDAIAPNGTLVATGPESREVVNLLDLKTQAVVGKLDADGEPQSPILFSPDNSLLATLSGKLRGPQRIALWDLRTHRVQSRFPVRADSRAFFCFSPNGRYFAMASIDSTTLTVRECKNGDIRKTFDLGSSDFWGIAFSPDSRLIAACGQQAEKAAGQLRVWDIESGAEQSRIVDSSTWGITSLAFSPDGRALATGDGNGKVKLWDVPLRGNPQP